jgi:hypothetical protein
MSLEAALPRPARFSIGRVLGDSVGLFAHNAIWLMAITCTAQILVQLAPSRFEVPLSWPDRMIGDFADTLASALADAAIALCVIRILNSQRPSVRDVTTGLRYIVPVTIVTVICTIPWTLSIIVDALWASSSETEDLARWLAFYAIVFVLYVRWGVATQANVVERLGAFAGLTRSAYLTKGRRWAIFGVTITPLVVVYATYAATAMLFDIIAPDLDASEATTLARATDYFISALSSAYFAVQTTVLYYYLRREKDGVESGEVAHLFD